MQDNNHSHYTICSDNSQHNERKTINTAHSVVHALESGEQEIMHIVSAIDWLSGIVNPWVSIHTELCSKLPCASTYFTRVSHVAYVMAVMRQICAASDSKFGTWKPVALRREEYYSNEND